MSDFELRPRRDYEPPAYPGPVPPPRPMLSNPSRPWAALALVALPSLAVGGSAPPAAAQEERASAPEPAREPKAKAPVLRLAKAEIEAIVAEVKAPVAAPIQGEPALPTAYLTEAEARDVIERFLKKNGIEVERDALVRRAGVECRGLRAGPGIVKVLGGDLTAEEADELRLLNAKGELRVLLLDGAEFEYSTSQGYRHRPTREGVLNRLQEQLERFVESLR
jgi:hypothetical protein